MRDLILRPQQVPVLGEKVVASTNPASRKRQRSSEQPMLATACRLLYNPLEAQHASFQPRPACLAARASRTALSITSTGASLPVQICRAFASLIDQHHHPFHGQRPGGARVRAQVAGRAEGEGAGDLMSGVSFGLVTNYC